MQKSSRLRLRCLESDAAVAAPRHPWFARPAGDPCLARGVRYMFMSMSHRSSARLKKPSNPSNHELSELQMDSSSVPGARKVRTLRFGSVKIKSAPPAAAVVQRNVAAGHSALTRAKSAFLAKGVKLGYRKDVPFYSVDPEQPGVMIRRLNGRVDRGRLVDGVFVPSA